MPLTIPAIPDADAFAPFDDDVGIFTNTKAREVPAKLNAIAQALKVHLNTLWLATATGFINDTVVANLNTALADIQTFTNALETGIDDQLAEFETNLGNYLGVGAGYSIDAANSALFTGAVAPGGIVYDADGRAVSFAQGPRTIHSIVYNDDDTVAGYTEELDLGGVTYSHDYAFAYDANGLLESITEA